MRSGSLLNHGCSGALLIPIQDLHPPGIDHDILARRQKCDNHRKGGHLRQVVLWIAQSQAKNCADQKNLDGDSPTASVVLKAVAEVRDPSAAPRET